MTSQGMYSIVVGGSWNKVFVLLYCSSGIIIFWKNWSQNKTTTQHHDQQETVDAVASIYLRYFQRRVAWAIINNTTGRGGNTATIMMVVSDSRRRVLVFIYYKFNSSSCMKPSYRHKQDGVQQYIRGYCKLIQEGRSNKKELCKEL